MRRGVFGREVKSLELFRVQDINFVQSWWQELLGIGTLVIMTSDQYHPREVLVGIEHGIEVRDMLTR
ncbi:membrane-flanked domain protein, partial [mine drainage metagenome]